MPRSHGTSASSSSSVRSGLVVGALTICAFVALVLMLVPVLLVPVGQTGRLLLTYSIPELGFAAIGLLFLVVIGEDRSFIDIDRPTASDATFTAIASVLLAGFNLLVHWAFATAGFSTASRFSMPSGIDPVLLLAGLSVVLVMIVGPSEELFFRGVVQRYLDEDLSRLGAYAWTSVIFAAFHLPAVAGTDGGLPQYVLVGGILFVVSMSLGWLYDRTRNLLVPAMVHGIYNVLVFASLVFGVMP